MGSTKHEKSFVDFEKAYEQNIIGLRGIFYFGIGLIMLIIITFALMWALLNVMEDAAVESAGPQHPLSMSDRERLPPEPRLQAAPGFEVRSEQGSINLELLGPQAEYNALKKIWDDQVANGQKHPVTGTVVAMPVGQAKEALLQKNVKARSGPDAAKAFADSITIVSDSSAGRLASEKRH